MKFSFANGSVRSSLRKVAALAAATLAVSGAAVFAAPAMAHAAVAELTYQVNDYDYVQKDYDNVNNLIEDANKSVGYIQIKVYEDLNISERIVVPRGGVLRIFLNGHMINRGLAGSKSSDPWWGTDDGQAIYAEYGAKVIIDGGEQQTEHPGKLSDDGRFWKSDLSGTTILKGGLITGAAGDAYKSEDVECAPGAIAGAGNNDFDLDHVTIAGNVSDRYLLNSGDGAGIYIRSGKLDLYDCKVVYNHAHGCGGGIFSLADEMVIEKSTISNNYAGEDAGAIYAYNDGTTKLLDSQVTNNKAARDGGGVFFRTTKGELKLDNSTVSRNISGRHGGGIHEYLNGGKITASNNSMISSNVAAKDGGGVYLDDESVLKLESGSSVIGNTAKDEGGGVFVNDDGTNVILDDASIASNTAKKSGGGIYHNARNGKVELNNRSMINENKAEDGDGGGIYDYYNGTQFILNSGSAVFGNSASKSGGGLYLNDVASVALSGGSTIDYNEAGENGGGVFVDDDTTSISLKGGSAIKDNSAKKNGGGLCLADSTNLDMEASYIKGNSAGKEGGGIYAGYTGMGFKEHVNISMNKNSCISNNSAVTYGGGIADCIFEYDFPWNGGELNLRSQDKTALIENNSAGEYGGGVYGYRSDGGTIQGVTIKGCVAKGGAGIYLQSTPQKLEDITVTGNNASLIGGGVLTDYDTSLTISGKIIIDGNTMNGNNSNLVFDGYEYPLCEGSVIDKSSRIGVTVTSLGDTGVEPITAGTDLVKGLGYSIEGVIYSDDQYHWVYTDDNIVYCKRMPNQFALEITDANGQVKTVPAVTGTTVELKSSDYVSSGNVVDYWTITGLGDTHKLYPENGVTSFKMPGNNVRVSVVCKETLSTASISLRDNVTWERLGVNPRWASVSAVSLKGTTGSSYGITTSDEIRKYVWVQSGSMSTDADGRKVVTYEVNLSKMMLENFGLECVKGTFKGVTANVSTKFATVENPEVTAEPNDEGGIIVTVKATFEEPKSAVTVNAVNVNAASSGAFDTVVQQVSDLVNVSDEAVGGRSALASGDDEAAADAEYVTIVAPNEPGWEFVGWEGLPEGAIVDENTHTVTMDASAAAGAELRATYKPLASAVSISVADLKVGEAFPASIESCKVAGANERDITSYMSGAKLVWTKADGSDAGATVEGDTTYKCTISAGGDAAGYLFGFDSSVYATVNGTAASVSFDASGAAPTVSYIARSDSDDSFDSVVSSFPVISVYDADDAASSLPELAYYKLKNGEVKSAAITWDTSELDDNYESGTFAVKGTFEDKDGDTHEVSQKLSVIVLYAPEASYQTATDGSGDQTVTLTAGDGWSDVKDYKLHYVMFSGDEVDITDLDYDDFSDYTAPVVLHSGEFILAYADVTIGGGEKQSYMGAYGRTLDAAKFKLDSKKVAYGSTPTGTLTMDGTTLKADEDYSIQCDPSATVGKAYGLIFADEDAAYGCKAFTYTIVPADVTSVAAKTAGKKKAKLSWTEHKEQTDGFQVRYATSKAKLAKNKGKAVKVKGAAKKNCTVKGLKSGKKYFFKVRAYKVVDGKTYYSAWSKVKAVKVK